jgi:1,4-alpha-glucan branching enzyme
MWGLPVLIATVELDDSQVGWLFRWGVSLDGPAGNNLWGMPTEINDRNSTERYRSFELRTRSGKPQEQRYYLTNSRRLGAQNTILEHRNLGFGSQSGRRMPKM